MPIIERKDVPDSIVYSDVWKGYNVPDVSDFHHFRIHYSELFADDQTHINGIAIFWNQAKRHMHNFTIGGSIPKCVCTDFEEELSCASVAPTCSGELARNSSELCTLDAGKEKFDA